MGDPAPSKGLKRGLLGDEVGELLAELRDLGGDHELAVALTRIAREVLLVVILGGVEGLEREDLRHHRVRPELLGFELTDDFQRCRLLFGQGGEDGGAVLRADIIALAVEGGGVVNGEEDVQKVGVRDLGGVEGDAHHLSVTGMPGTHLLVSGIDVGAAGITGDDIRDADDLVVNGFEAPEAAAGKNRDFEGEDGGFGFHIIIVPLIGLHW